MSSLRRILGVLHLVQLLRRAVFSDTEAFKLGGYNNVLTWYSPSSRSSGTFAHSNTLERVTSILCTKFEKEEEGIAPECNYRKEFGADNLDEVELLLALEEEFDVNIPDHDFNDLHTVKDIADYLERQLNRKAST
ncbi:hypothetical protein BgAZ_501510 [Babesia gibsoni]|uniref:Acyl carrier protein n=1 Tax=Babesia gibsoni TaxID=33632 RepID=A0AAD8LJ77_BABGI|nr:hypothetical protein BgAZ_501510 [Babesia gibsoni]